MKWHIVTDSSIDLFNTEINDENIKLVTVPFTISVGVTDFLDDEKLDIETFMDEINKTDCKTRTACPSVGTWYEEFKKEGNIIAITISGGLSGSYSSACAARNMIIEDNPNKKIVVIDSLSVGPEMVLTVRKICELINQGMDFDGVVQKAKLYLKQTHVIFALSSFNNLVRNGRIHKLTGFAANRLGFLGIGMGSEEGTIEMKGIVRGKKKAINMIINSLKEKEDQIKQVVISHCQNQELAETIKKEIQNIWMNSEVTIIPTRGLCSYYAEQNGLIIGY